VKSTPSPSTHNRFSILSVDSIPEIYEPVETPKDVPTPEPVRQFRPRWERSLPAKLVIASTENEPKSLKLKVSIETTDTAEVKSVNSLVNSGATGNFIDWDYVRTHRLTTRKLSRPVPVFNVDGTPNEAGSITEVVDLILRYQNHSERTLFAVTGIGKQHLILGHSWLRRHNPEIDWVSGDVKMSRCSARCCSGCRDELCDKQRARKMEACLIGRCLTGPLPMMTEDDGDELPALLKDDEDEEDDPELEEGDRMFAAGLHHSTTEIRAPSTISQWLAEAFKRNSEPIDGVPEYLREFDDMFSKESFDVLPDSKPWDYAIELVPGAEPAGCKVYLLSPSEQRELDVFLQENLDSGRIRPSKSPMASPVFFIKKMEPYASSRTTGHLMRLLSKTSTHFH
jgi:hypothetical protein